MSNRQFARCDNCNTKPATIRRWSSQRDCTRFCYHCDTQIPSDESQRKEIIPYDEMMTDGNSLNYQKETSYQSITPQTRTPVKQSREQTPQLEKIKPSTDIKSFRYSNNDQIKIYHNDMSDSSKIERLKLENISNTDLGRSETKAIELKYRIRLQEQDNTIQVLKGHLENIESSHQENLFKVKNDIKQNEEVNYKQVEKYSKDIQRIQVENENRISQYMLQLEQERQRREILEQKLDSLRKNHESKMLELQQQITQLRAENERQKMEKEQIIFGYDEQISISRQLSYEENEKIIQQIKQEFTYTINDYNNKLSAQQDQNDEAEYKIQQLQVSLQEVNLVWKQRDMQLQHEVEEMRTQLRYEIEQKERYKNDKNNLHQELNIIQKEQELIQKEKTYADNKMNQMNEKTQKLERFIYGEKKNKKK